MATEGLNEELLNTPEKILYSTDDFPVIEMVTPRHYEINWNTRQKTALAEKLQRESIYITTENANDFNKEFLEIRERFGFNEARLEWYHSYSFDPYLGWHSVTAINPFPEEVEIFNWLDVFSPKPQSGEKKVWNHIEIPTNKNKAIASNVEKPEMAIFYIESLAHYLKYAGISFPYISTSISEKKGVKHLLFSFKLPYTSESQSKYEYACLSEPLLNMNHSVSIETGLNGEKVWVANDLSDPLIAIKLFNSLSEPLRQ